ncbi:MAG: hypothetical protein AB1512_25010 [Thermodesulfobacteriota bacterium]
MITDLGRTGSSPSLRGGAFNNNQRNVRCANRNRNNPNNRNDNIGFRVVLAHGFPILPEIAGRPFRASLPRPSGKPARSVPVRAHA